MAFVFFVGFCFNMRVWCLCRIIGGVMFKEQLAELVAIA
jgi:hypothetical protein